MKRSKGEIVFQIGNAIFMLLLCAIMVYPYLNSLALSLNDGADAALGGITIFPREFSWMNYATIFKNQMIGNAALLSVARVLLGTLLGLVTTAGAAYAMIHPTLPGRKWLQIFLIIPMFISGGLIPNFILFRYLKLMNNFWLYVFVVGGGLGAFSMFNMVIVRTFFHTIPESLEESARIDGANDVQVFFRIILPLSKPVLATVTLWLAVGHWNDWVTTLYYVPSQKLWTLQYILMKVVKEAEMMQKMMAENARLGMDVSQVRASVTSSTMQAATLIVVTLPIILVYPFLQKYFVNGVMIGAIKE